MERLILTSIHKPNVLLKEKKIEVQAEVRHFLQNWIFLYNWILVNVEQQYFLGAYKDKFIKETLVLPCLIFKHLEN